jgi:hypothetical protein
MKFSFAGTVSPDCVTFTSPEGKNIVIPRSHVNNDKIRESIKEMQAALKTGDESRIETQWRILTDLADIPVFLTTQSGGKVHVVDGTVFYEKEALHNSVSRRILWGLGEGYDMESYIKFLENLMENPSKRAVDELFDFLEACNMGITEDGCFLAYKVVRSDYTDCHTGTFDNSVGVVLEMPRNKVDEDKNRTCSTGFHFCSMSYLPAFGAGPGRDRHVMILKINPRDVVAIPADYANAKGRACIIEVVGEYTGPIEADPLSSRPVWSANDVRNDFTDWDGSDDDDDGEYDDSLDYFDDDSDYDADFDDGDDGDDGEEFTVEIAPVNSSSFFTAVPDSVHQHSDVNVAAMAGGGLQASFEFFDNGIGYDFNLVIDPNGKPVLNVQEFQPRIVKHDEISENAPAMVADRNQIIDALRNGISVTNVRREVSNHVGLSIDSSLFNSMFYNDRKQQLILEFKAGHSVLYHGVPSDVVADFLASPSKGNFFNSYIRDGYEFDYV